MGWRNGDYYPTLGGRDCTSNLLFAELPMTRKTHGLDAELPTHSA